MDDTEFAPEEISDFSLKDGADDADVVADPLVEEEEVAVADPFAEPVEGEVDPDAAEMEEYMFKELYEEV